MYMCVGKVANGPNKKLAKSRSSPLTFCENRVRMPPPQYPFSVFPPPSFSPRQLPFECQMSFVPSSAILHFQLAPFHNFRVILFLLGANSKILPKLAIKVKKKAKLRLGKRILN